MALFLLVAFGTYGLANFYILRRGWQALAGCPGLRAGFSAVFVALVLSYPLARLLFGSGGNAAVAAVVKTGSFYLALMIYLLMGVVLVDLVRLAGSLGGFLPKGPGRPWLMTGPGLFVLVAGAALVVVIAGSLNAVRPRVRDLDIRIDKPAGGRTGMTVVVGSDLHLGMVSGISRLRAFVTMVNALGPDLVLLPGDIVDESVTAKEEDKMTSVFQTIRAPLGIYSVPGNHEYYSGLEQNLAFLAKCGVRVLQDEAVKVAGCLWLVGRRDPTALRRGEARVPIGEIMARAGLDKACPIVLLDHQPLGLGQAEEAGIDLELSGHTHAGQLFPLNIVNKRIYEQNWGYLRKGKTQYYVSCGFGTWGPPVRTGSIPEIMRIHLTFRGAPEPSPADGGR